MIELRKYQEKISSEACNMLKTKMITYLSMEVRTGKTITALNAAKLYGAKSILFLTKKKAIEGIVNDTLHFPELTVIVINYESVHKRPGIYDLIIVDEAHSMGAYPKPSKRAKDLKEVCKNKPIIFLSGTPSPESYSQLFHQFWISSFSPWKEHKNFYSWARVFVEVKKRYLYGREINDYSNARQELIDPVKEKYFIDYTQLEAGFDVKIEESVLKVPMSDFKRDAIKTLTRDRILTFGNDTIIADTAVKLQSKIHQICSGTVKVERFKSKTNSEGQTEIVQYSESLILDITKAVFIKSNFHDQRIAIYYKFIGEKLALQQVFGENSTEIPEEFQSGLKSVFLGQFQSAREGIRLDQADAMVMYNIDFSFLSYEQTRNRFISKERTKQAKLYWIFTEGGIEEKIYQSVLNKQDYTNYYFKRDYGIKNSKQNQEKT